MSCGLIDVPCHLRAGAEAAAFQVQNAIWEWWAGVGFINKLLIVAGLWFLALYLTRGVLVLVNRLGGWKAAAGYAAAVLAAVVWAFLKVQPKRPGPSRGDDFTGEVESPDARGPFRVPPPRKRGGRVFDPVLGKWSNRN